jgi:hypothetical protein
MQFSDDIIKKAWRRAEFRCECTRKGHDHVGRCTQRLLESYRGEEDTPNGWEAHSKNGSYTNLSDCEIICWNCQWHIYMLKIYNNYPQSLYEIRNKVV